MRLPGTRYPISRRTSFVQWLIGAHHARPGVIILGVLLFAAIALMPTPEKLKTLLTRGKDGEMGERRRRILRLPQNGTRARPFPTYYSKKAGWYQELKKADGTVSKVPLSADQVAFRAKVMTGVLVMAALFWATGAIPIGITALLVGVMMYFFGVLPPDLGCQGIRQGLGDFHFRRPGHCRGRQQDRSRSPDRQWCF